MEPWKILICDDDETIHEITSFVLTDFTFLGRSIQLLHAYNSEECILTLKENPDTSVLLLDMIMEAEDTGVNLTRMIREELENKDVRIILRTGESINRAPKYLVEKYDISNYFNKSEFTSQRLNMALYTGIMTFKRIRGID